MCARLPASDSVFASARVCSRAHVCFFTPSRDNKSTPTLKQTIDNLLDSRNYDNTIRPFYEDGTGKHSTRPGTIIRCRQNREREREERERERERDRERERERKY